MWRFAFLITLLPWWALAAPRPALLHVSYDATREMFAEYNAYFANAYAREHGVKPRLRMSHGGSGKQARSVMDGLPADVVSLALAFDIDAIAARGKIAKTWRDALPNQASPFHSTVVLLVRAGNPKHIHDWNDLARADVTVLTPNPKTSGAARLGYVAALAYAKAHHSDNAAAQQKFMCAWLARVPVFDTGARASTTNFVRRNKGDVLITWENEARVAQHYFGADSFDIIYPSISVRAEPVVAKTNHANAHPKLVQAYVAGLFWPTGQALAAKHFFRTTPAHPDSPLPELSATQLVTLEELGGMQALHAQHFAEGALFDRCTVRGNNL